MSPSEKDEPTLTQIYMGLNDQDKLRLADFMQQHQDNPLLVFDFAVYLRDAEETGVLLSVSMGSRADVYLLRNLEEAMGSLGKFLQHGKDIYIDSQDGERLYSLYWMKPEQIKECAPNLSPELADIKGAWIPEDYTTE